MEKITLHTFNTDIFTDEEKKRIEEIWKKNKQDGIRFRGSKEKEFVDYIKITYGNVEKKEEEKKEYWFLI